MGARLINNPKTVSGGDVHDYFSLKLHDLKARGFFVDGKATIRASL